MQTGTNVRTRKCNDVMNEAAVFASVRDTMDSVKQSAALCLLRLNRTSPDLVPMGEWTARVVHLLNDQHLVRLFTPLVHIHRAYRY